MYFHLTTPPLSMKVTIGRFCCTNICLLLVKLKHLLFPTQDKYLVVMMSTGHIYFQQVVPECGASDGPIYLTVELPVQHHNIKVMTTSAWSCDTHVILIVRRLGLLFVKEACLCSIPILSNFYS